ncbi:MULTISPECIES: DUF1616 domain-containing protein [unclassified Methanoculleus]|uniref:DUF1616 domain-containing protein n=1 Tax=unclassified Methanoculleus TaxID=2619537 RepID=UPI0025D5CA93|nr:MULTISPECIES: DUF1616 domain-containing protein [unclassified Methanoculleus]MCK9317071.1 DUF1616 domain-containing protein [Methanoculleus sp.]MDD2253438.1 DUF1616 domain-containing protein [Methanoculleus sp.]MDD2788664.1 DUF1616 domain-containing protein [Methanoculleus sp.]MDD3214983.1 DUF1616 domain-containing protein [Methanoculleus sp.]MDD4313957.1 DUF1616 domain-containing protein [Methanoculleus sp.]
MPPEPPADRFICPAGHHTVPPDVNLAHLWVILALIGVYLPVISGSLPHVLVALPFISGLAIAIVLLFGLVLNYIHPDIRILPVVASLAASSVITGLIAGSRRCGLPEESRCTVPFGTFLTAGQEESSGSSASRINRVLGIVLVAALLVAIGTTIFIVVAPDEGERFTEFYILGPKGTAADYPTEFMAGTPQTVIIGIGNHEHQEVTYTVETFAVESRLDTAKNQSTIVSATLLDRFSVTVPHNQTVEQPYTFRISDPDTDRIEFLLFKETPPDEIPVNNLTDASYRNLRLWLRVH